MKIIKKGLLLLTSIIILAGIPAGVCKANDVDDGYYIENYDISMVVHKDNTYDVTEKLKVFYNESRHGIKRSIPETYAIDYTGENGDTKAYNYSMKIEDVSVDGAPYSEEHSDGYLVLTIGDENERVTGEQEYTITYTFDFGDDRIDAWDMFYFNIIGPDWDTSIDNVNFDVNFDKDVDLSKASVYAGYYGDNKKVDFTSDTNEIYGTVADLSPGESLTVDVTMPEGYYVGERTYSKLLAYFVVLLQLVLFGFIVVKRLRQRNKDIVQTVEFYPPGGITSADVGYIIDGSADDKDLLSLFLWLADNGYMTISDGRDKKDTTFAKLKELNGSEPMYVKIIFQALFSGSNTSKVSDLKDSFFDSLAAAKVKLSEEYTGAKSLEDNPLISKGGFFMLLSTLVMGLGIFGCGGTVEYKILFYDIAMMVELFVYAVFLNNFIRHREFKNSKVTVIATIAMALLTLFICWGIISSSSTLVYSPVVIAILLLGIAEILISATFYHISDYKAEMVGKLLGLKDFIKTAELDKINALVEQDPEYFYHILPYAYVFELTDKWVKQFETLAVPKPDWYYSDMSTFSTVYFMSRMNHCYAQTNNQMTQVHAARSAASSGSGGGGGFSGGGAGGGGGSSW